MDETRLRREHDVVGTGDAGLLAFVEKCDRSQKHAHRIVEDGAWLDQLVALGVLADPLFGRRQAIPCRTEHAVSLPRWPHTLTYFLKAVRKADSSAAAAVHFRRRSLRSSHRNRR